MMGRSLESRLHAKKNKILYFVQLLKDAARIITAAMVFMLRINRLANSC